MTRDHQCTEARFLKEVAHHQMEVIRDDGVHRHLRFRRVRDGRSCFNCGFEIVTWPNTLCIEGDCGTYVFSRTEDMFQFFRTDRSDFNYNRNGLSINPGYWGEKLQAVGRHEGYKEYTDEAFKESLRHHVEGWGFETPVLKKLWRLIEVEIIRHVSSEHEAWRAVEDFDCEQGELDGQGFNFNDFWECYSQDYSYHYIWCIYAIAWSIETYDESKKAEAA